MKVVKLISEVSRERDELSALKAWVEERHRSANLHLITTSIAQSPHWHFDGKVISRKDAAFFRVVGVRTIISGKVQLDLPFIEQKEIGILGFLISTKGEEKEILLQSKPEPGNFPFTQIAPTVQATISNYKRRHGGAETHYLDYFNGKANINRLAAVLQSEQGTRFLGKYNENIAVTIDHSERPEAVANFRWTALDDLLLLLSEDLLINTDARSVIVSTPWAWMAWPRAPFKKDANGGWFGELLARSYSASEDDLAFGTAAILKRLQDARATPFGEARTLPLSDLQGWKIDDYGLTHERLPQFIGHFQVNASGREVESWDQPLYGCRDQGRCILICQVKNGILHFLFSSRFEPGFAERYQFGPAIQLDNDTEQLTSLGAYDEERILAEVLSNGTLIMECRQTDEGGRFYRCFTRYEIYFVPQEIRLPIADCMTWISLRQVEQLASRKGCFSNEARTLISMLLHHL